MIRLHFIVLIAVITLLGVGGPIAAYAEDAAPAKPEAADAKSDKKPEAEGEGKKAPEDVSGGRFAGDPIYVHVAPLVLPIITANGAEQIVTVAMDIQVKDFNTADDLHTFMPKIMDALMTGLYGGLGEGSLRNGKLVNIAKIKAKAVSALRQVVPGDGITDVLIQGVAQRTF